MQERLRIISDWLVASRGPHGLVIFCLSAFGGMMAALWTLWCRQRTQAEDGRRERAMWEELEAYARLDVALGPGGDAKPLAWRVCRAVVEKSRFCRVAMLVRDAEGKLFVAGEYAILWGGTARIAAVGPRGEASMLSTGMSKNPWICPACRSIVSTRLAPASVIRLATSLALIGVRDPDLRSCRA